MLPHFKDKYRSDSLITPARHMEYIKAQGRYPSRTAPQKAIFCYQSRFLKSVLSTYRHEACDGCFPQLYFLTDHPGAAIADFGIGAPAIALKMELLIAWGVQHFISMGTAGSLQSDLKIGDLIVCDRAIRDEGVSYHYAPPAKYAECSPDMVAKLKASLEKLGKNPRVGTSWTMDSFFRETPEETRHWREEGVLCVEMEASALFTIASFRKVKLGAMFTISDMHDELNWEPHFDHAKTLDGLHTLLKASLH